MELLQHIEVPEHQRVYPAADHGKDGSGPRIVAGMEKVVQRYAKLFLTNVGSVKFDEAVGGTVYSDVRNGRVPSRNYLSFICTVANNSAVREMKRDDADGAFGPQPDDEAIESATVDIVDVDETAFTVKIHSTLVTRAGSAYNFVIPVNSGISA